MLAFAPWRAGFRSTKARHLARRKATLGSLSKERCFLARTPFMTAPDRSPTSRQLLHPPQFGLKTLLGLVTLCGMLFALSQWLHPAAVGLIAFLAVSVFCHMAGNALGIRLRQIGDSPSAADEPPPLIVTPRHDQFAPRTLLSRRQSLGWTALVATSIGVTSGAIGGGLWTFAASAHTPDAASIIVGMVAFAVLGGMAAFLTIGFAQVLFAAYWQALSNPPPAAAVEPSSDGH